jgi:hypothetical protein
MADKKISELTTLAQGSIDADADFLAIVDTSATETKKSTPEAVVLAALGQASAVTIPGTATINSTVIPNNKTLLVSTDIGSTVQGYDADTAKYDDATANFTGTLQNGGSNVVVDTDIGATVQAYDATLASLAGVTTGADKVAYFTGVDTASATDLTSFGRSLIDDADASAGRTTLGLGTIATQAADNVNIDGGTIDGAVIGGSTAAAGSFTTLNTSGAVVFNDAGADVDFRVEGDTDANLLFVDASTDRVGIGTSSPSAELHVQGNLRSANAGNTVHTELRNDGVYATGTGLYLLAPSGEPVVFYANDTERMRITSSGNVGIGTSTPTAAQLVIKGDGATSQIRAQAATNTNQGLSFIYNYSSQFGQINCDESGVNQLDLWYTALNHKFGRNTATANMTLDASGNVGIGTNAPINELTFGPTTSIISPDTTDGSDSKRLRFCGGGAAAVSRGSYVTVYGNEYSGAQGELTLVAGDAVGGNIVFYTGSAVERMRIDTSGNVGIGTSSPKK